MNTSYSIKLAKEMFVFVTPRGSLARNHWGESWTRNVDDALKVLGEDEAVRIAKQINDRLGKREVSPDSICNHMKLCWGFNLDKELIVSCMEKYFPKEMEVISDPPHPHPDAQKYAWPRDKAFASPKLAWEHLKAKRIYDLEYAQRSLDEINSDLRACEAALRLGTSEKADANVVSFKRGDE